MFKVKYKELMNRVQGNDAKVVIKNFFHLKINIDIRKNNLFYLYSITFLLQSLFIINFFFSNVFQLDLYI